jgi:hypothetical protein
VPTNETVIPSEPSEPTNETVVPSDVTNQTIIEGGAVGEINRQIDMLFPEMAGQLEGPNPTLTVDNNTLNFDDNIAAIINP